MIRSWLSLPQALSLLHIENASRPSQPSEIETACRVVGPATGRVAAFLKDWLDLLAEGAPQREDRALSGTLEAALSARAA